MEHSTCLLFLAIEISFTNNISDHFFRDGCTFLNMVKLLSRKLIYSKTARITQPQLQAPPHMTTFHNGWKAARLAHHGSSWEEPQD